jgi:hypothetical protein
MLNKDAVSPIQIAKSNLKFEGSSVSLVTSLRCGRLGFDSRQGQEHFLFATAVFKTGSGAHPAYLMVSEVKRPEREAVHSPPSSFEVKNVWSYTYLDVVAKR